MKKELQSLREQLNQNYENIIQATSASTINVLKEKSDNIPDNCNSRILPSYSSIPQLQNSSILSLNLKKNVKVDQITQTDV